MPTIKFSPKIIIFIAVLVIGGAFLWNYFSKISKDCRFQNRFAGYMFYFRFPFTEKLVFPTENTNNKCFYEFYEGIYEASFLSDRIPSLKRICDHVNKGYPERSWDQCFFILGTAITYTKRDKIRGADDLVNFMNEKAAFCESLGDKSSDCIIGIYTGVNLAYQNDFGDSVFPIKDGNPFWICNEGRASNYKLQCYRNLVSILHKYTGGNTKNAVLIIKEILTDPFERFEVLLTYFSSFAYERSIGYAEIQRLCAGLTDKMTRLACIEGYATGIDEVAPGETVVHNVVEYCLSRLFSFEERGECIRRGFFELPTTKDLSLKKEQCLISVPKIYTIFCDVEKEIPPPESN